MEHQYYYIDSEGKTRGPVERGELKKYGVTGTTKVWRDGMAQWEQALKVEELQADFSEDYNLRFMPGYAEKAQEAPLLEASESEVPLSAMAPPLPPPTAPEAIVTTAAYDKASASDNTLKQRHGCVSAWLWVGLVGIICSSLTNLTKEHILPLGLILTGDAINLTICIMLLRWKKLGLILYYALILLGFVALICIVIGIPGLSGKIPGETVALLYGFLFFGFFLAIIVILLFHWISQMKASDGKNFYENLGYPANSNPFSIFSYYFKTKNEDEQYSKHL